MILTSHPPYFDCPNSKHSGHFLWQFSWYWYLLFSVLFPVPHSVLYSSSEETLSAVSLLPVL
jgi:hypothetical protein